MNIKLKIKSISKFIDFKKLQNLIISKTKDEDSVIFAIQFLLLLFFYTFVGGIIGWIVSVIRLSWELQDTPSASIGISIVAIPLFLVLLGIVNYVFWGLTISEKEGEEKAYNSKRAENEKEKEIKKNPKGNRNVKT